MSKTTYMVTIKFITGKSGKWESIVLDNRPLRKVLLYNKKN